MDRRTLGQGLEVSQQGLGCMGMSEFYGVGDDEMCIRDRCSPLRLVGWTTSYECPDS